MDFDMQGNIYLSGYTDSINFPTTDGAIQKTFKGGYGDAFVAKLSADGSLLLFSTYLGSAGPDHAFRPQEQRFRTTPDPALPATWVIVPHFPHPNPPPRTQLCKVLHADRYFPPVALGVSRVAREADGDQGSGSGD